MIKSLKKIKRGGGKEGAGVVKLPWWIKSLGKEWKEMAAACRTPRDGCSERGAKEKFLTHHKQHQYLGQRVPQTVPQEVRPRLTAPAAGDRAEVTHGKSAENRWGHTIPAFCRLSRVVGFVSLLPHLGKSNHFKTGV